MTDASQIPSPEKPRRGALRVGAYFLCLLIAVFLAANLAVSRTSWWFFQPWIGPLARQNMKLTCAFNKNAHADLVLIGDSRVRHTLVAGMLEEELGLSVNNLGVDASLMAAIHEVTARVMASDIKPRFVLIGVSEVTLNDHGPRLRRDLRLYARPGMMLRGLWSCPDFDQKAGALEGLTRGIEVIFQLPAQDDFRETCRLAGISRGSAYIYPLTPFAAAHNQKAVPFRDADSRRRAFQREVDEYNHENMRDFSIGFTGELLGEVLDMIAAAGARAVIMIPPESADYVSKTENPARGRAHEYLAALSEKRGILLIDLTGPEWTPPSEDFFDYATHMGPDGALAISREVCRKILKPGLEP